ncbi:hypothetical protein PoB_001647500 [Plakobranchus ocellatus]|uniref:Uncharacterized protein n=1 Tax=Plakobranchus ocellatus TaxID=259542 RepID=A0AAV3Z493_9GAST|nr:hypothetical protein PoB_001647500 [Plakobranchus ocellatus]
MGSFLTSHVTTDISERLGHIQAPQRRKQVGNPRGRKRRYCSPRRCCSGDDGQPAEIKVGMQQLASGNELHRTERSKDHEDFCVPILRGEIGGRIVDVMWDTGFEVIVVRKGLVEESQLKCCI